MGELTFLGFRRHQMWDLASVGVGETPHSFITELAFCSREDVILLCNGR